MPILEVEIVGKISEIQREHLAQRLADGAAEIMDMPKGTTWVRLRVLAEHDYAENGGREHDVFPVFVSFLRADPPSGEALDQEVLEMSEMIASLCDRPLENVHVRYESSARGRQAFGGTLIK